MFLLAGPAEDKPTIACVFSTNAIWDQLQIFSLWAESDRKYGGLSLSSEDVGQVLAITGSIFLCFYQCY